MTSSNWLSLRAVLAYVLVFVLLTLTGQAQQPSPQRDDVIRITTELVQTDVSVVDKQGRFVEGLKLEQFELLVDGKPQPISFFEQVVAGSDREVRLVAGGGVRPATESEKPTTSAATRGRTIFFFIDDMHLAQASMLRTRETLQKFVNDTMTASDRVAITTASGRLGFLQQLTNDKAVLTRAIERLKPNPYDVTDLQNPPMTEHEALAIERNDPGALELFIDKTCEEYRKIGKGGCQATGFSNNAVLDEVNVRSDRRGNSSGGTGTNTGSRTSANAGATFLPREAEREVRNRARVITRKASQVTLGTLTSLESLIRTAAVLPERKLVIFVSDGFFINFITATHLYDLRRATDAATRSGTVIYTIDARGLVSGLNDATKSGMFDRSGRAARLKLTEVNDSQQPLFNLADATGGRAWLNANDLAPGIARAISETSSYYLLAWRPDNAAQTKDGFRNLKVIIKDRPDLIVRARAGFFAEVPEDFKTNAAESALSVDEQLMATIRSSYPKRGIPIVISAGYLNTEKDGWVLAASCQIDKDRPGTASTTGSEMDVMGSVIDERGNVLSSLKQQITFPADGNSLVTTFQFPKLPPGLIQIRIAARDSKSGKVGSATQWVEIPGNDQGAFSISSLFLSESGPSIEGQSKWLIKPGGSFLRSAKLKFQAFVYNADRSSGAPRIQLQMELRRDGQLLIQTPPSPIATEGVTDLARIPVAGEFPLQSFQPGHYELRVILTDPQTKKSVSQQASLTITNL